MRKLTISTSIGKAEKTAYYIHGKNHVISSGFIYSNRSTAVSAARKLAKRYGIEVGKHVGYLLPDNVLQ